MIFKNKHLASQNALSSRVYDYYNNKKEDRNLIQATDGYVHHHFGLGPTDQTSNITAEVQRQENKLTSHIIELLGIQQESKLLDVACGRGGNMFRIADEYPLAVVDGINITHYQAEYCTDEINTRGFQDRMEVRQANFLSMPYPNDTYSHEYCCEVTQYTLDLSVLFDEVYRTLKPGGVFVIATWCYNEDKPINRLREIIEPINTHYASTMHSNAAYKDALITSGFKITHDEDRTEDLIPYWELRDGWDMASGIESNFIDGHTDRTLLYKFFIGVK